jgi:hypothetical protein
MVALSDLFEQHQELHRAHNDLHLQLKSSIDQGMANLGAQAKRLEILLEQHETTSVARVKDLSNKMDELEDQEQEAGLRLTSLEARLGVTQPVSHQRQMAVDAVKVSGGGALAIAVTAVGKLLGWW